MKKKVLDLVATKTVQMPAMHSIEEAVIGALLVTNNTFERFSEKLHVELFDLELHKSIFLMMQQLWTAKMSIDIETVFAFGLKNGLIRQGAEDLALNKFSPTDLINLSSKVASDANFESHLLILYEYFARRELLKTNFHVFSNLESDVVELLQVCENNTNSLRAKLVGWQRSPTNTLSEAYDSLMNDNYKPLIVPMPFKIDTWQVLQGGNLNVLAARPGMGKTAFTLAVAFALAKQGHKVLFFSTEMRAEELMQRVNEPLFIDMGAYFNTGTNHELLKKIPTATVFNWWGDAHKNLIIYDKSLTTDTFPKLTEKLLAETTTYNTDDTQHKPAVVILDYLQRVQIPEYANTVDALSRLVQSCKEIAKNHNVAFIALSQFNRESERRENKRPTISDLKGTGTIEQEADSIYSLYRPAAYGETTISGVTDANALELHCLKDRHNGQLGQIAELVFNKATFSFNPI